MHDPILFALFVIFTGAAIGATLGLVARQSLLVIYILLGILAGPWGVGLVSEPALVSRLSQVGVLFLLFLLGLNLHPQRLFGMLRKALWITLAAALAFATAAFATARAFGFPGTDAFLIAAAAMFSSTIIGLKLLPATELHHRHSGEVIIAVLLLQDLLAIFILLVLEALGGNALLQGLGRVLIALPLLLGVAYAGARFVLVPLFEHYDTIREYLFLMALGWCLGMAQLAGAVGISPEIGAFAGGVALASHPVANYIAESLRPLRDFFLVMFFFSLGAAFDWGIARTVWIPALVLCALMLVLKPSMFRLLLGKSGEAPRLSWEIGVRLGQWSEFSLFIAYLAAQTGLIGHRASATIQLATLISFLASSYLVMWFYPTPIAVSPKLRQD